MKKADFEKLMESIEEAGQIKAGRRKPARVTEIKPPDIKRIRQELDATQREFALMIGVRLRTL